MKRFFAIAGMVALLLAGCDPKPKSAEGDFQLPAIDDIAMYQVNPRVFAPDHSLQTVAQRIDSIAALGGNMMWVMPSYPIGIEKGKPT